MKLILKQSVSNLGDVGEVVTVKPGYARNYLIPQGLAYVASDDNLARIEAEQAQAVESARRNFLEALTPRPVPAPLQCARDCRLSLIHI